MSVVAVQTLLVKTTSMGAACSLLRSDAPATGEPLGRLVLRRTSCTVTLMHQSAVNLKNPRVWKRISHHNAPVTAQIIELKEEGKSTSKKE